MSDNTPYRSVAIAHAEIGADSWNAAYVAQRDTVPEHADFYALAGSVVDALRGLRALTLLLAEQVVRYGDRPGVFDDDGADPRARLDSGAAQLRALDAAFAAATDQAYAFWSTIGHIGVND